MSSSKTATWQRPMTPTRADAQGWATRLPGRVLAGGDGLNSRALSARTSEGKKGGAVPGSGAVLPCSRCHDRGLAFAGGTLTGFCGCDEGHRARLAALGRALAGVGVAS